MVTGTPGSILTFFPWPDARRGRQGGGQVAVTSFSILPGSVGFWIERPESVTELRAEKMRELYAQHPEWGSQDKPIAELPEDVRVQVQQATQQAFDYLTSYGTVVDDVHP